MDPTSEDKPNEMKPQEPYKEEQAKGNIVVVVEDNIEEITSKNQTRKEITTKFL